MKIRFFRGARLWLAIMLLVAAPVVARNADPPQAPEPAAPPTVEELQRQVEELTRQLLVVQQQVQLVLVHP